MRKNRKQLLSTEQYKGYELRLMIEHLHYSGNTRRFCLIYKDGEYIALNKTKKSAKEMIDNGCYT